MTQELWALLGSAGVMLALILLQAMESGAAGQASWGLGNRDTDRPPTILYGRLKRATANHIEGMMVFTPLILVATMAGLSTTLTVCGAWLFLAARIAYTVIYLVGIPVVRTLVWFAALAGILMVGWDVVRLGIA